ncbi:MAG TPA: hypothetical protein VLK24_02910 [Gaiellaceae bacterium]|nr:hypothetical protein [Gaiellaceae bacterium]
MFRARVAVALLLIVAGAAAVALASRADGASNERFRYSHTATVDGLYVDHWTMDETYPCGRVGDGTVTVKWHFKKVTKVRLFYDPYAGARGSWVLGSPAGGGVGHMPAQPGIGTITLVDNTTQHPPNPGDTCETTTPKSDCGTVALLGPPLVGVTGDGKTRLVADLARVDFDRRGGAGRAVKCSTGQAKTFADIFYSGRANAGKLAIPMASISAVNHRRVVRVSGSSHKVSGNVECASGDKCTDEVTRKVTVTFKRL